MQKKYFIVYENKKGKRTLVSSTDSTKKLIFSSLNGEIVCASYKNRNMKIYYNEHFTKNLGSVRGNVNVRFTIADEIAYSKEPNADKIIDVIVRSVLDKYFSEIEIKGDSYEVPYQDVKNIITLSNYFAKEIIPFVKITGISDISIGSDNKALSYKNQDELSKDKEIDSFDEEYYVPSTAFLGDDLCFSKMMYPERVYVPQGSILVFQNMIREPGVYKKDKAMGSIVSKGKHVYSPLPVLFTEGKTNEENKYMLYPNVIYDVKNLTLYLENYDEILNIFRDLISAVIKTYNFDTSKIDNFVKLEDIKNRKVKDVINKLKDYNIYVEYITYSVKNPCVRSKQRVKKVSDLFDSVWKENS